MAPELFSGQTYDGEKVDIFALGVILFMMLTAMEPFHKADDLWHRRLLHNPIKTLEARKMEDQVDEDALDLILKMIQMNAADRCTMDEILGHKWFNKDVANQN
jgi:serine/threonine protein kinase